MKNLLNILAIITLIFISGCIKLPTTPTNPIYNIQIIDSGDVWQSGTDDFRVNVNYSQSEYIMFAELTSGSNLISGANVQWSSPSGVIQSVPTKTNSMGLTYTPLLLDTSYVGKQISITIEHLDSGAEDTVTLSIDI